MQGDFAQETGSEFGGRLARPALAEDLRALVAAGAEEIAHVLDDAEDRHLHFTEYI